MALKGTLKDFGIADIFQLIGQQAKTGVLIIANKPEEVRIGFVDGNVVWANKSAGKTRELLGQMLVSARLISDDQLQRAVVVQKKTLKRLGDILVGLGHVTRQDLRDFTHLQTTETIYKLFFWKSGTYEFIQEDVNYDQKTIDPIRSENLLMEGFRQVDEWPMIRRRITSYGMTFRPLKEAAPSPENGVDSEDELMAGLDAAFAAFDGNAGASAPQDELASLGPNERRVFELVRPDREVQALIDLSRLGEFETCKALFQLVEQGYIEPREPSIRRKHDRPGGVLLDARTALSRRLAGLLGYAIAAGLIALAVWLLLPLDKAAGPAVSVAQSMGTTKMQLAQTQARRIDNARRLYLLIEGRPPASLQTLVDAQYLSPFDLRWPPGEQYTFATIDGATQRVVRMVE